MKHTEQWIWLPKAQYPNHQTTVYSGLLEKANGNYVVAEFFKEYRFEKTVLSADLRFSGDTNFQLYCNDTFVATGPASVGGDFIHNEEARENFYAFETEIAPGSDTLRFFARVRMMPVQIFEYSRGRGGFMLSAILTFADGTQEEIVTDESWLVRKNGGYTEPLFFDSRIKPEAWVNAEVTENIWNTETAPIPVREEYAVTDARGEITFLPHEETVVQIPFEKIWGGFLQVKARTQGEIAVEVLFRELDEPPRKETLFFSGDGIYRSFCMQSAGNIEVCAKNHSDSDSGLSVSFIASHYPVTEEASTVTSDTALNLVLETCRHTLKICRQTHHLDSTKHLEPMACTGDYNIEAMMTPFSFGDMRLAAFDLVRTAVMLERENGRMFHTTYSLIWVRMLYDVYLFTGDKALLSRCEKALSLLLDRFLSYLGENGLIETPPDYMFVDWIYLDGISLHHPPKALGQTCLNLFYFGALDTAAKIYRELGDEPKAGACEIRRDALKKAVNTLLFDEEKRMYHMGLNTPTDEAALGEWMPQNVEKRYYLKHANVLAAYVGVCDDALAKDLIRRIMADEIEGDCQPYFLHYLLEAIARLDLREYTLSVIERWKAPVMECSKGLAEGFYKPEPTYSFDHSHAWGGTPLYSLPKALLGLTIHEPGMKKLSLSPSLLGLEYASVELLTPHGKVTCKLEKGKAPQISSPDEVTVTCR